MNKGGFIRTVEAVIAIIIVFVFIFVISQRSFERASAGIESIKNLQEEVLRGISENEDHRDCVVELDSTFDSDCLGKDLKGINFDTIGCSDDAILCLPEVKTYVEGVLPKRFDGRYALVICETNNCGIPDLPDENVYTSAIIITSSLEGTKKYNPKVVRLWVW